MPAKCPFCETGTHGDQDKEKYPECVRVFLTPQEVYKLIQYNKDDDTVHVFIAVPTGIIIGADWGAIEFKNLIEKVAIMIEVADEKGLARKMKHGIAVSINRDPQDTHFIATNEEALQAFEKEFCNGK
jgi:hypothetical protein